MNPIEPGAFARIIQDAKYAERLMVDQGLPFGYPIQSAPASGVDCTVEITEEPSVSDDYYTGKIVNFSGQTTSGFWWDTFFSTVGDNLDCKVIRLSNEDRLVVGRRYPGKIITVIEERPGVFLEWVGWPVVRVGFTIPIGCGLKFNDESSLLEVNLEDIVGDGLVIVDEACPKIAVDPTTLPLGCGLTGAGGILAVDLTEVVFDGLYFDAEICALGINVECGITYVGDGIGIDRVAMVGNKGVTSLVVSPNPAEGICEIAFDAEAVSSTTERLVNYPLAISLEGNRVRITYNWTEYTNYYNTAAVHIGRQAGVPQNAYTEVSICDPVCESPPPPPPPPPLGWDCVEVGGSGDYECQEAEGGTYATEEDCKNAVGNCNDPDPCTEGCDEYVIDGETLVRSTREGYLCFWESASYAMWTTSSAPGQLGFVVVSPPDYDPYTPSYPLGQVWAIDDWDGQDCILLEVRSPSADYTVDDIEVCCEGSSGGDVGPTLCCPDRLLPSTLTLTVTDKTGGCTCVASSYTMTYDEAESEANGYWVWETETTDCGNSVVPAFRLMCSGGYWSFTQATVIDESTLTASSCESFQLVFDVTANAVFCAGTFTATITE